MSGIKKGSIVEVVDTGALYRTYTDMFQHIKKEGDIPDDFGHKFGGSVYPNQSYVVLSVMAHLENPHIKIALIHNDNKHGYLVDIGGLELA